MSDDALQQFAANLTHEIEANLSPETPFTEEVFTQYVIERLEDAGHMENAFDLYQEGRIRNAVFRIDGYAFDEERLSLDLFTTIYSAELPPPRLASADVTKAFERALRFASACVDGLASQLEPSNTDASDLATLIEKQAKALSTIRIVLLTNASVGNVKTSSQEWHGHTVEFEVYDIVRLHRILGEGETRADIAVDLVELTGAPVPCLHVEGGEGEYQAYLAVFPGEVLSKIYDRYGARLLELNVRAFLGLRGRKSVNAELRRTIVEKPSMFLAFNNGIVATVDDLELQGSDPAYASISVLKGLQIVNGGQTTASLHRARRKESISLTDVAVPIKIIKVAGADLGEMVGSISRAANRQNTVQLADFSANDPFHQEVENLANNTWLEDGRGRWFYERARGSYLAAEQKAGYRKTEQAAFRAQTPKHRRLSKLDLARYLTTWHGLPHRVCLGGQKNFQHFMQAMKDDPPPSPDATWFKRLIALAVLYRAVEKKIRVMKFPAYRAQIAAYIVAGMGHRTGGRIDFDRLWTRQAISSELEQLIETWAPLMDQAMRQAAGQRNPSEWYKKEECWTEVQNKLPVLSDPLPPELSYSEGGSLGEIAPTGTHSVVDYERIERCMKVDSATWLLIAEKGKQEGLIHWKVAGICTTLASYAAGGWQRKPSAKQAKPALEAMQKSVDAGLIPNPVETETARSS